MSLFTPTEVRILDVLADGEPHSREQLRLAVDEFAELVCLQNHISNIRKKLELSGLRLVCHSPPYRPVTYQLVRILASAYTGYK